MAADLYPSTSLRETDGMTSALAMHVDDNGYYWHLYPYFESAKLPCGHELVDLYGSNAIDGYELDRLRAKMIVAKNDLSWRPESWDVVTGWDGHDIRSQNEIKKIVDKAKMVELIDRLIALIDHCKTNELKLCVYGD